MLYFETVIVYSCWKPSLKQSLHNWSYHSLHAYGGQNENWAHMLD